MTRRPSRLQRLRPLRLLLTVPPLQAELQAPRRCLRQTSRASAFKCRGAAFGLCAFHSESASGAARFLHPCHLQLELRVELPASEFESGGFHWHWQVIVQIHWHTLTAAPFNFKLKLQ